MAARKHLAGSGLNSERVLMTTPGAFEDELGESDSKPMLTTVEKPVWLGAGKLQLAGRFGVVAARSR